jgi:hypothetical protein
VVKDVSGAANVAGDTGKGCRGGETLRSLFCLVACPRYRRVGLAASPRPRPGLRPRMLAPRSLLDTPGGTGGVGVRLCGLWLAEKEEDLVAIEMSLPCLARFAL